MMNIHFTKQKKRIPRKKGQHRGSKSHSDLYTDENPKGTIHGLSLQPVDDAKNPLVKSEIVVETHCS